ncbi:hypothetical protein SDC9_190641 [bioreactor metagenome]|uniref:Uncharacterized protein n=1 Tax=bioreactor metagenome TaxID=1076179 RepID=A0A645HX68_9ZZZZ
MLDICGQQYTVDLTDIGFIEGVVLDFSGIMKKRDELQALREQLLNHSSEEQINETARALTAKTGELCDLGERFIKRTLGDEAYAGIFADRARNAAEHLELCAYIYGEAIRSREGTVSKYVLPEKPAVRAVKAGGKRKAGKH